VYSAKTAHNVLVVLVILAIVLVTLVAWPFGTALLLAAVLAGVLRPAMERLTGALRGRRAVAAGLLTLAVLGAVVVPVAAFAATLVKQIVQAATWLRETLASEGVSALLRYLPASLQPHAESLLERLPAAIAELPKTAASHGGEAAVALGGVLSATGGFLFQSVLMLIALYFLLHDGSRLVAWLGEAVPLKPGQFAELLHDFRRVAVAVVVSTLATAGVQSVMAFVGFVLASVPSPAFFTLATFLSALVPALGATVAVLGVAALKLATGHKLAAIFLAAWGLLVVGLVDNVVKPLFMRGGLEIHGAVIFFSLLGGLAMFGPIGLVVGPLAVAFLIAVVRIYRRDFGDDVNPPA
jgi:predicted PurR-regulated permease PerM